VPYNETHADDLLVKGDEAALLDHLTHLVVKEYVIHKQPAPTRGRSPRRRSACSSAYGGTSPASRRAGAAPRSYSPSAFSSITSRGSRSSSIWIPSGSFT
jgi:hypothetical protein